MNTTIGDGVIATAEGMFDDEFQRAQYHRSMTVGMYAAGMVSPFAAAGLVPFLPREAVALAILAFAPVILGELAAATWLRRSVPRPRKLKINRAQAVVQAIGVALLIAAVVWRISNTTADLVPTAAGAAAGAAAGIALVALFAPRVARAMHRRDTEAIDRRLDGAGERN